MSSPCQDRNAPGTLKTLPTGPTSGRTSRPSSLENLGPPSPRLGARLFTVDEVATFLAVSKSTVYRLVERRELPFVRLPGALRFAQDDLQAFLGRRHVEAIEAHDGL